MRQTEPADAMSPAQDPSEDHRVARTKRQLADALVALALERPFHTITVRDLTGRASVGYATFFRHYKSVEELLRTMLGDLLTELVARLRPLAEHDPEVAGEVVFAHAVDHPDLYRVLLRTSRSVDMLPEIVRVGVDNVLVTYAPRPDGSVPSEIAAHHFIRAFMDLIEWWLDHDMPYPPQRMAEIYAELIVRPIERVALAPR